MIPTKKMSKVHDWMNDIFPFCIYHENPGRYRHESENLIFLEHQRAAAYGLYATFYNGLTEGIKVWGWEDWALLGGSSQLISKWLG